MAVSIMKKLSLFALSSEAEALIARLTWLSCVELTKTEPEDGWLRAEENSRFGADVYKRQGNACTYQRAD